nr:hypothetical protein [Tanacetum cinerariifolium]
SINEGEAAAERISNDSEEIARVLTSMDAVTVLAGGITIPTGSGSIPTAGPPATVISTGSEDNYSKVYKFQSQQRRPMTKKQKMEYYMAMIRNNLGWRVKDFKGMTFKEIEAKLYSKVYKFQSHQRRPMTKKQKMEYYMAMIRNNLGWKVKDFKGMTFEEIEAKFAEVWKHVEDFIPMGSKEETERLKRKGLNLEQEQVKKQKSSEEAPEFETSTKEFTKEKIKEMMQLVPVEDVYVQSLQVKHSIIDWKVHTEAQRSYWKIIRLGGSSACYQFFVDLLKQLDKEDLNQLWALVNEYLSIRPATNEPASPVRDVSEGEASPTDSCFIADQDRATIAKSSTLPHDSAPRVTSHAAYEGSMQHTISKLTALCTSLQRQYSEMLENFQAQEEDIVSLKEMVQALEDRESVAAKQSGDDAPIKGRSINEGEAAAERISNDSEEIARVLTSMDA